MAVWPFLLGFAMLMLCVALLVRNGYAIAAFTTIVVSYIVAQGVKHLPISGEVMLLCFAAIWVLASVAIKRHATTMAGQLDATRLLTLISINLSALCYFVAWVLEIPPEMWSPPYVASDVLLVLAMLCAWWGIRNDLVDRIRTVADNRQLMGYTCGIDLGGTGSADHGPCREAVVVDKKKVRS